MFRAQGELLDTNRTLNRLRVLVATDNVIKIWTLEGASCHAAASRAQRTSKPFSMYFFRFVLIFHALRTIGCCIWMFDTPVDGSLSPTPLVSAQHAR